MKIVVTAICLLAFPAALVAADVNPFLVKTAPQTLPQNTLPQTIQLKCQSKASAIMPSATNKGPTLVANSGPSEVRLLVDGANHNPCGNGFSPYTFGGSLLASGTGMKFYSFSNVAKEKDVRFQLKRMGFSQATINKTAPGVFKRITSAGAKRLFFVIGAAELGHTAYQLIDGSGVGGESYSPVLIEEEPKKSAAASKEAAK